LKSANTPAAVTATLWNLGGYVIPLAVAVIAIPPLLHGLGTERFGFLTFAWVVLGYFGVLDLGVSQATTRFVAAKHADHEAVGLSPLLGNALVLNTSIGAFGCAALLIATPWLTERVLQVPPTLRPEAEDALRWLAYSIPLILVTGILRAFLEALGRFDLVNMVKIPASVLNMAIPLGVLSVSADVATIVFWIVIARVIVLVWYSWLLWRTLPPMFKGLRVEAGVAMQMLRFGGWLSVSNLVGGSFTLLDRVVLGAVISLSAVAFYATPYEIVTKLWLFSAALLGVLFPIFSSIAVRQMDELHDMATRSLAYLLCVAAPCAGVLLALPHDLLAVWINAEFAARAGVVVQWLAVGVFINVLAQVPLTVLHGLGRADVTAKLLLIQVPLYAICVWVAASNWGITGVAAVWAARAALDASMLLVAYRNIVGRSLLAFPMVRNIAVVTGLLCTLLLANLLFSSSAWFRLGAATLLTSMLVQWAWRMVLAPSDRRLIMSLLAQIRSG
jgi:O-antigen/teichoic acid export membrane protein